MSITKEDLLISLEGKTSTREVALSFAVSQTTIRYYLKKYDINKFTHFIRKEPEWRNKLKDVVPYCVSFAGVLKKLGLSVRPGNYTSLKLAIKNQNIETSHFLGKAHGTSIIKTAMPFDKILVEDSVYVGRNKSLKRRLLRAGMLINKCQICGCDPVWKEKPLVLVLDHINGKNNDNRIENLRLLCSNCNSQQPTFCRGYIRLKDKIEKENIEHCKVCGKSVWYKTKTHLCQKCAAVTKERIARGMLKERPSKQVLADLVQTHPLTKIGEKYGVSGNTIKKWMLNYGIQKVFGRGDYAKKYFSKNPPPKEELSELIKTGTPLKELAKKYNADASIITKWRKLYGIPSLSNSEKTKAAWKRLKERAQCGGV